MKLRTSVLLIPLAFGLASVAYGQEGEAPPSRFIIIDDPDEIQGERIGPDQWIFFEESGSPTSSLIELRWSFVEKMIESVEEIR